ncbi:hypothetical protein PVAND_011275 [Polypedilum vanderplanki]|uniref:Uncharacterized protein n=1 Tax=Polypedilum vanderplanki TaxID=319348 RepID=A0A9J6CIL8_POLVA|nr:hypothetical protein PVAND_011275 [Polypedilum vanderplanki]
MIHLMSKEITEEEIVVTIHNAMIEATERARALAFGAKKSIWSNQEQFEVLWSTWSNLELLEPLEYFGALGALWSTLERLEQLELLEALGALRRIVCPRLGFFA